MTGQKHIVVSAAALLVVLAACISHGQEPSRVIEIADGTNLAGRAETDSADSTVTYDSARYQLIVEREPFGSEPLVDQEEVAEAAAAKALEQDYRLCFLLENDSGEVRAGFQNKKAKAGDPRSVMLRIGESFGAMKLLDIDLKNSRATLEYRGQEVSFNLEKPKVAAAKPVAQPPPARPQRRFGGGFRRTTPPEPKPEPEPEPEPEPQLTEEERLIQRQQIQQNLREYQMEVLRQGMPPLPIQLTPEQDDQLVAEGVLPPMQE